MSVNLNYLFKFLIFIFCLNFNFFSFEFFAAADELGQSRATQRTVVRDLHNPRVQSDFVIRCIARGIRETFCRQMTSPNTNSAASFRSVYGSQTPFVLMPAEERWETGLDLLVVAEALSEHGEICEIRNWYRPEPYNSAVGGARASQHLSASAIDIEFCTVADKNRALRAALAMRQRFQNPPGVGVYGEGSRVIHIDLSNRIYGPGIAQVDRAAAQESVWSTVREPGSNLQPNRAVLQALRGAGNSNPTTPRADVRRQGSNNFFRHILSLFTGQSN